MTAGCKEILIDAWPYKAKAEHEAAIAANPKNEDARMALASSKDR